MGCCNDKIKGYLETGQAVFTGYFYQAIDKKCDATDDRIRVCHRCDEQTWLSIKEYFTWLKKNGVAILKNLDQLETLPRLEKFHPGPGRSNLFCRLCKCFVPAKARVENQKCPLGKWPPVSSKKVS